MADQQYSCSTCSKQFSSRWGLLRHQKKEHGVESEGGMRCQEESCEFSCRYVRQLRSHLSKEHSIKMDSELKNFSSEEEFAEWKAAYEAEHDVMFVKSTGDKTTDGCTTSYYQCNRSGVFLPKGSGQRRLKSQGSSKINTQCTAAITLTVNHTTQSVKAEVCHTHYAHEPRLGHIRLSEEVRLKIAGKLVQGVTYDKILDDIRSSVSDNFKRIHLIQRKDINNIERAFKLEGGQRHHDDATSVAAWVEEMRGMGDDNVVLYYKPQGADDDKTGLKREDFLIVLQTPIQAEMLIKFAEGKVVCVDATHGTNAYDFKLITLLVVDEYGEGFPVAWCITNKEDRVVLIEFLSSVRTRCGMVRPLWFMSDMAEQYYLAWVSVFDSTPRKLLCTWHVDRAWRGALQQHVTGVEKQAAVYSKLRVLLKETDKVKFTSLLGKVHHELMSDCQTQQFVEYFDKQYGTSTEEWASCHRLGAGINTNMYVEAFHNTLKQVYMRGQVNRRVDKCLHLLLWLARDKAFDRLVKLEKGKTTNRLTVIHARHKASLELSSEMVSVTGTTTWAVKSAESSQEYTVNLEQERCTQDCALECTQCNICVHMYSCACCDYLIRGTICKHIHLVARTTSAEPMKATPSTIPVEDKEVILQALRQPPSSTPSHHCLLAKLDDLQTLIRGCTNAEALSAAEKHITAAFSVLKALTSEAGVGVLPKAPSQPSNKKVAIQRFKSTKKKRKSAKVWLAKPSREEKAEVIASLLSGTTPTPTTTEEITRMLQWFTQPAVAQRVTAGGLPVSAKEVHATSESLPDEAVDAELRHLRTCFSEVAWVLVSSILSEQRRQWQCEACLTVATVKSMIACDWCDKWFHWDCVNLTEVPEGDWLCDQCFTTPAHPPLGGLPDNNTVPSEEVALERKRPCGESDAAIPTKKCTLSALRRVDQTVPCHSAATDQKHEDELSSQDIKSAEESGPVDNSTKDGVAEKDGYEISGTVRQPKLAATRVLAKARAIEDLSNKTDDELEEIIQEEKESLKRCHVIPNYTAQLNQLLAHCTSLTATPTAELPLDTVFSEARVMELIDRERDKGTFAAILKGDVPSCYLSEYQQRQGNPYKWAYLWDKFPLSKKLWATVEECLWKLTIPLETGSDSEAYSKARYILYPEVMIYLLMDNLHVEKEVAHALYSSGRQIARLINCAAKLGKTTIGAECSPSTSAKHCLEPPNVLQLSHSQRWTLTNEQVEEVKQYWQPGTESDSLRLAVRTLRPRYWMNADVVDYFLMMIEAWARSSNRYIKAISSVFLLSMERHSHDLTTGCLRLLPNKHNAEEFDSFLIPVIKDSHWRLVVLKRAEKQIIYCDPKKRPADRKVLDKVTAFIRCRLRDTTAWKVTAPTDIPLQGNSDDCGVFVCMYAMCYALEQETTFTQEDIPQIRQWMAWQIIQWHVA